MTPIHPEHRQEAIDELTDLLAMLQTSEILTYEDLDQRVSQLRLQIQIWRPDDTSLADAIAAIDAAQSAIKAHILGTP